jgi:CO/xanthine dehydrogenase Mo-binding subunit
MTAVVFDAQATVADDEYRIEGRAKVSGEAAYAADAQLPNMLFAAFAKVRACTV